MGEVGVTVSSSSAEIAGVSNMTATVTNLEDGISTYTGTATITNPLFKNMIANFPGATINGDEVTHHRHADTADKRRNKMSYRIQLRCHG